MTLLSDDRYAELMREIILGEPCRGVSAQPSRLLDHVYIGSQSNAESLRLLRELGVTHVLNCAGYKGPRPVPDASPYEGLGIDYCEFQAEDTDRYDICQHFPEAFQFLEAVRRRGGVALVHCALGINRSAAVCVGYLMVHAQMTLLQATRLIKNKRRVVLANRAFQRQLVRYARSRGLLDRFVEDDGPGSVDRDTDEKDLVRRLSGATLRMDNNNYLQESVRGSRLSSTAAAAASAAALAAAASSRLQRPSAFSSDRLFRQSLGLPRPKSLYYSDDHRDRDRTPLISDLYNRSTTTRGSREKADDVWRHQIYRSLDRMSDGLKFNPPTGGGNSAAERGRAISSRGSVAAPGSGRRTQSTSRLLPLQSSLYSDARTIKSYAGRPNEFRY